MSILRILKNHNKFQIKQFHLKLKYVIEQRLLFRTMHSML